MNILLQALWLIPEHGAVRATPPFGALWLYLNERQLAGAEIVAPNYSFVIGQGSRMAAATRVCPRAVSQLGQNEGYLKPK
jgi:hypothetical protein